MGPYLDCPSPIDLLAAVAYVGRVGPSAQVARVRENLRLDRNRARPPVLFLAPPRWHGAHCTMRSLGRLGVSPGGMVVALYMPMFNIIKLIK